MPDDLFTQALEDHYDEFAPLAARMRPRSLDEFEGQQNIVGPGTALRSLITTDRLASLILWGPPGSGKTTLAEIIARETGSRFVRLSAVSATVADMREAIFGAKHALAGNNRRTILFIDEVHRFNKAQQDTLLPAVENGYVILVGATTENPFFEINSPLMSRCLLFRLERLEDHHIRSILERAIQDERGFGGMTKFDQEALDLIIVRAGGDARQALNALEVCAAAALAEGLPGVTSQIVVEALKQQVVRYDRKGDQHYDIVSAFIKSLRGSDPDAAVLWLTQMIDGGEDPRFVARRMIIFASEDIGNADPMALVVATSAFHALEFVGLPEAGLNLAQAAIYLATAPKSNASAMAVWRASEDVRAGLAAEVPLHLRDSNYPGAGRLGHGKGYEYPHSHPDAWVDQSYVPPRLEGRRYYEPSDRGAEREISERLKKWRSGGRKREER